MKRFIDRYTKNLIKENFMYFAAFVVFVLLIVFMLPFQIKGYTLFKEENKRLAQEVSQLERKRALVASFNPDEIENLIATLNTLLPQTEDYFSIFQVLDNLSQQTGLKVTGVVVSFAEKSSEELSLSVSVEGSLDSFLAFLDAYHYKGGRLITMDKVAYTPSGVPNSLTLTFHTKKVDAEQIDRTPQIDQARIRLIKKISDELAQSFASSEIEGSIATDYPVSDNPFGSL